MRCAPLQVLCFTLLATQVQLQDPWYTVLRDIAHWCEHVRLPLRINRQQQTLVVSSADARRAENVGNEFCERQARVMSQKPPPNCTRTVANSIRMHAAVLARAAGCTLRSPPSWSLAAPITAQWTRLPPVSLARLPRVYIYPVPERFRPGIHSPIRQSDMYAAEIAFATRLLRSPLRTLKPEAADLFFVPFFSSQILHAAPLRNGSQNSSSHSGVDFGVTFDAALELLEHIQHEYPHWNQTGGSDHVWMATHDIGAFLLPNMVAKFSIVLQHFGDTDDNVVDSQCKRTCLLLRNAPGTSLALLRRVCGTDCVPAHDPRKDVVIPPYVAQDSLRNSPLISLNDKRPLLLYFRGTVLKHDPRYGWGVRNWLLSTFGGRARSRATEDCSNPEGDVLVSNAHVSEAVHARCLGQARFCFAPPGWQSWSAHLAEAILAGCVPVIVRRGARHTLCDTCPQTKHMAMQPTALQNNTPMFRLPFESQALDYGEFALVLPPSCLPCLESILRKMMHLKRDQPMSLSRLQQGVAEIRARFAFSDTRAEASGEVMDAIGGTLLSLAEMAATRNRLAYSASMHKAIMLSISAAAHANAARLANHSAVHANYQCAEFQLPAELPAVHAELSFALMHAHRAVRLDPTSAIHHLTLAQALLHPLQGHVRNASTYAKAVRYAERAFSLAKSDRSQSNFRNISVLTNARTLLQLLTQCHRTNLCSWMYHIDPYGASNAHSFQESQIPLLSHQSWKQHASLPRLFAELRRRFIALHPSWTHMFWSDNDVAEFALRFFHDYASNISAPLGIVLLRHLYTKRTTINNSTLRESDVVRAVIASFKSPDDFPSQLSLSQALAVWWAALPLQIMRLDLWRAMVLYHYGGVYMDLDYELFAPLDLMLQDCKLLLPAEADSPDALNFIGQALLASVPRHTFWLDVLATAILDTLEGDAVNATGPHLVTRVYRSTRPEAKVPRRPVFCSREDAVELAPVARGIHYITGTWRQAVENTCSDNSFELRWARLPRSFHSVSATHDYD